MCTAGKVVRGVQSPSSHFLDVQRIVYLVLPSLNMPDLRVGWEKLQKQDIKKSLCLEIKKHGVREGQRTQDGTCLCRFLGRRTSVASATLVCSAKLFSVLMPVL